MQKAVAKEYFAIQVSEDSAIQLRPGTEIEVSDEIFTRFDKRLKAPLSFRVVSKGGYFGLVEIGKFEILETP